MVAFAHNTKSCRQVQLLQFFTEPVKPGYSCGKCDVCESLKISESVEEEEQEQELTKE